MNGLTVDGHTKGRQESKRQSYVKVEVGMGVGGL